MAFRDEEVALRSRFDALEREANELRAENARLSALKPSQPKSSAAMRTTIVLLALAALSVGLAALAGWRLPTHGDDLGIALSFVAATFMCMAMVAFVVARLLVVVPPGQIVVISGRRSVGPDGSRRGFRVVSGGRTIRIPLLEIVSELHASPIRVALEPRGVYTKSGIRTNVNARGILSVARQEPGIAKAVERFLGRSEADIHDVGRDTLEGALRELSAMLTIHELREDREKVSATLSQCVEDDLSRLGLVLESFHILDVIES